MIHWNNLSADERKENWRHKREELKEKTYNDRLKDLSLFFSHVPYGPRSLDYYTPNSWLSPWEILHYGEFCRNSISLLMFHTLNIIDPDLNIKLCLVDDSEDTYLITVIDNTFVLGMIPGQVTKITKIKKSVRFKQTFEKEQITTFA
jgi:hypothetical protein